MKLQIAEDIVHAMMYLHTRDPSVIHGDLKIQNVVIGDAYRAKVNGVSLFIIFFCSRHSSDFSVVFFLFTTLGFIK